MARVTVTPEEFTMVEFDAGRIGELAEKVADDVGLPDDLAIHVEVDQSSPLGRATVESHDPVHVSCESGALEDPKLPRQLSDDACATVLGRLFFNVSDRRSGRFDDAPADEEIQLPQSVTWSCSAAGRLSRLGYPAQRQRWLYHFRNRHGFTDAADEAFRVVWDDDAPTWAGLVAISDRAAAANPAG